jgi:hypothetical protein
MLLRTLVPAFKIQESSGDADAQMWLSLFLDAPCLQYS